MQVVASNDKEIDDLLAELPVEHQLVIAYVYQESERRNEMPSDATIEAARIFAERWRLANKVSGAMGRDPMTLHEALVLLAPAPAGARCH